MKKIYNRITNELFGIINFNKSTWFKRGISYSRFSVRKHFYWYFFPQKVAVWNSDAEKRIMYLQEIDYYWMCFIVTRRFIRTPELNTLPFYEDLKIIKPTIEGPDYTKNQTVYYKF